MSSWSCPLFHWPSHLLVGLDNQLRYVKVLCPPKHPKFMWRPSLNPGFCLRGAMCSHSVGKKQKSLRVEEEASDSSWIGLWAIDIVNMGCAVHLLNVRPQTWLSWVTLATQLDTWRVIGTTASIPAGSFIVDHDPFRVRNPQKYLPGNVQTNKNFWDSVKVVSSPLLQPTKWAFANRKMSGTYIPISNESHSFRMELFCVSSTVPNQLSFVSVTQHTWASISLREIIELTPEWHYL